MVNILFWNVNKKDLRPLVCSIALAHSVDVVILCENKTSTTDTLIDLQTRVSSRFCAPLTISPTPRFHCFSRSAGLDLEEVHEGARISVRRMQLNQQVVLLGVVHGIDMRNNDTETRQAAAQAMADEFRFVQEMQKTRQMILVGDFNMNPFDRAMNLAAGMNAMMTQSCVQRGTRTFQKKEYDFYYNPMWNLLGDKSGGPSGTVYDISNVGPYGWSMLDQVLVHHGALHLFGEVSIGIHLDDGLIDIPCGLQWPPRWHISVRPFSNSRKTSGKTMSNFWPEGFELDDIQSPREILEDASVEWATKSNSRLMLITQDGVTTKNDAMLIVHAYDVHRDRTVSLFTIIHRPMSPYPATISLPSDDLPPYLRKEYYSRGIYDRTLPAGLKGSTVINEWVCETPAELRRKLSEALNSARVKSAIVNLLSLPKPVAKEAVPEAEIHDAGVDNSDTPQEAS